MLLDSPSNEFLTSSPPSVSTDASPNPASKKLAILPRLGLLLVLLYVFLVAIELLSGGIKMMGSGAAEGMFDGISNPFAALAVGILCTVLVQSS